MVMVTAVKQQRPAPDYVSGPVTRGLRVVSLISVVALTLVVLVRYPSLPETVPTHFDFSGEADGFGSRSSVLWLAGGAVVLGAFMAWLSTRPQVFNYPGEITEANAQRMYREGERLMVWVLAGTAVVYLGIVLQTLTETGAAVLVVGLVVLLGSPLAGLVRMVIADSPG